MGDEKKNSDVAAGGNDKSTNSADMTEEGIEAEYVKIMDVVGDGGKSGGDDKANDGDESGEGKSKEADGSEEGNRKSNGNEDDSEDRGEPEVELPDGIPAELKAKIQKRINTFNRRAHEAEERAEAAADRAREAEASLREAEERLERHASSAAAVSAGVPKVMLAESEAAIDARESQLERFVENTEGWLDEHDADDTLEEDGRTYSYNQVKGFLRVAKKELTRDVPKARDLLKKRLASRSEAERKYPEMFKPGTVEYREFRALAEEMPEIRVKPDWRLLICRMVAGKKLEEGKKPDKKPVIPPPKAPGADSSAPKSRLPVSTGKAAFDQKKIEESGYDPEIIDQEYAKIVDV
jgi:hypothetical protein